MEARNKGGRPRGEPSTIVNVRIPLALLERLDRYLDLAEVHTGLKGNRNDAIRRGLAEWLDRREETLQTQPIARLESPASSPEPPALIPRQQEATPPVPENEVSEADKQAFHEAYQEIGGGRDFVRIHLLRDRLPWEREHFDRVLAKLAEAYTIELHGGDPSRLSRKQRENSYQDKHSTRYITLTWRG